MPQKENNPQILELHEYHLSEANARKALIKLLKRLGVKHPSKKQWNSSKLTLSHVSPPETFSFTGIITEMRKTGISKRLQHLMDSNDPIFGRTIKEVSIANYGFGLEVNYAGWNKKAEGPFRSSCVEIELTEDILDFRRLACLHSNDYNFRLTARYFRGYLSSCISIVDAFVNRHILLAEHDNFTSPDFEELKKTTKTEEKFRLWWKVFTSDSSTDFFQSSAWCHFQELRTKRNEILHAIEPVSIYSLKEIQLYLNKVKTGVGELLLLLRNSRKEPTLGFVERLRTAPTVHFNKVIFKEDGNHIIKKMPGG